MIHLISLFFIFMVSSCASMNSLDTSLLNHPGMDLEARKTSAVTNACTNLNGNGNASQAGCATCAK